MDPALDAKPLSQIGGDRLGPRMDRIIPLSPEAISQIQSSKHIISLQGVVLALLENSLDSGASKVEILVDFRKGCCTVEDNGTGIPVAEFVESGGLGKMHCSSKRQGNSIEFHGSTGKFLAELSALCLLSISSAHIHGAETANLILHHGRAISRKTSANIDLWEGDLLRQHGTTVAVRDLFGNMAVRVKQRGTASGLSDDRPRQELMLGVVALLIAWPKPCAVKLRDQNDESRGLNLAGRHASQSGALTKKSLHELAGKPLKFDMRDMLPVLLQSSLAPSDSRHSWIPLSASTSGLSLRGLICASPAPTKRCQFIALGISPCTPERSDLFDAVNKIFANSAFGVVEDSTRGDANLVPFSQRPAEQNGGIEKDKTQTRKGVDRHPMFCLQVSFKHDSQGLATNSGCVSDASIKAVVELLEAAVTAWLESNQFRPRKRRSRRKEDQPSPAHGVNSSPRQRSAAQGDPNTPIRSAFGIAKSGGATDPERKRRKIVDLSGRPALHDISTATLAERTLELKSMSTIKTGYSVAKPTSGFGAALPSRPISADTKTQSRVGIHQPIDNDVEQARVSRPFIVPTIEAGELDKIERRKSRIPLSPSAALGASPEKHGAQPELQVNVSVSHMSSDDFGSFDDVDMLAAVENAERREAGGSLYEIPTTGNDNLVTWTDPTSKQVFKVNVRTGVVVSLVADSGGTSASKGNGSATLHRESATINTALTSTGKPISLARRSKLSAKEQSGTESTSEQWLPGFLEQWDNPVFAIQEEDPIPAAFFDGPGLLDADTGHRCGGDAKFAHGFSTASNATGPGTKLSRAALTHVDVIGQVDGKFILCKLPSASVRSAADEPTEKENLVLVDQHAASERVILEGLLRDLTDANSPANMKTAHLIAVGRQALNFDVSEREMEHFARYREHFATWGIVYTTSSTPNPTELDTQAKRSHRITVIALPTAIAERCANFPALCIEMLRTELWALQDGSKRPQSHPLANVPGSDVGPRWLRLLDKMPKGLLDMLHSRSCRSAIMFNDVLSLAQCEELMRGLGECVFPFICAHGRVSMVPVGNLAAGIGGGAEESGKESEHMRRWMQSIGK